MKKTTCQTLFLFHSTVNSIGKKLFSSMLGIIFISSSFGANYYNVTGAANANNTASWTTDPGGAAGTAPADFVSGDVFTIRAATTINTNAAWIVSGNGSGIVIAGTLTLSNPLNISGGFTNNGTFNNGNQAVTLGTGGNIAGTGNITFSNLTINTANTTDIVTLSKSGIVIANNGTINITKGIFKVGTGNIINMGTNGSTNITVAGGTTGNFANAADGTSLNTDADGGTINQVPTSGSTVTITGGAVLYNITCNSGANGNFKLDFKSTGALINGTLTVGQNGGNQFQCNTNSPSWGPNSTLYINNNGQQYSPGGANHKEWISMASGTIGVTAGYPNNVTLMNCGTSASNYNGNQYGVKLAGAWSMNGLFQVGTAVSSCLIDMNNSGTGTNSFSCGGITIANGSKVAGPGTSGTFLVKGNWLRTGTYINNNGTVTFGGSGTAASPQTIAVSSGIETSFNNIVVTSGTYLKLNSGVTLPAAGIFNLTSGIVETSAFNILNITNTAITGITGTGSTTNFIKGPVQWSLLNSGTNIYHFPVGAGTDYLPLILSSANATNGNSAIVQAYNTNPGGTVDGTLSSLSTTEFWSITTTSDLTGSTISVARPTAILPFAYIGKSNTTANGVYTSIGGTAVANGVNNSNDIGSGTSLFFTLGAPPIVSTLAATSITTTGAILQGAFNTQGASHATTFNYGTTTAYGTTVNTAHSPINSNSSVQDSAVITGLIPNTEYHFVATDGVNSGSDVRFMTAPNAPTVGTPSNPTGNGFTASWLAPTGQGNAPYTYTVQVSADPTFSSGVITQTGIASGTISVAITGLASGTTYYYQVQAVNAYASSAWSATSGSITTNLVPTPPCDNNTSSDGATTFINTAPVIDGTIDAIWSQAPSNPMNVVTLGNNNNTQNWKSLWTTDSLYLLVQVTDASLIGQGAGLAGSVAVPGVQQGTSGNYYEADGIEFYLDPDNSHGNNYDGVNDVQLRFNLGSNTISGQSAGGANQFVGAAFQRVQSLINWKMQVVPGGYLLEAAIPWGKDNANPGIFLLPNATYGTPTNNQTIGLDIGVNDQDNTGGDRQAQIQWFGNSPTSYQNPNQFKSVGLQLCPEPPIVVNPTKVNITATSADLGATVVSSGKDQQLNVSPLTVRGTAYGTATPVTSNAEAEGNTALGIYSSIRTGLSPQTKYYYAGYANNAAGLTGVSSVDSFYTLSALPTVQPVLSATTCAGITLNWGAITFPPVNEASQTGYLILRRQDGTTPATTGIATRVATKQIDLPAGTTLVATINSGVTLTYTDVTAAAGTTYNYLLVPFTWDGTATDSTYNYFITGAPGIAASIGANITPAFDPVAAICSGANLNALPLTSTNNITGTWSPALNNTANTTYTFTPAAGQCATTATLTITVNQSTTPAFNAVAPICAGDNLNALPLTSANNITGTWSPALDNTATTTYTFTPAAGQCANTATLTITVSPLPTVSASADPAAVIQGATVTLTGTSNSQGTYTWTALPQTSIESSGSLVATSRPEQNSTYTFTVTDGAGCSASDDVAVTVTSGDCLKVRNAFTPNRDGHNDKWIISNGTCAERINVNVYNRWGGLVYTSSNYKNDWEGNTNNNKVVPDGTYYYVIQAHMTGGGILYFKGNVTIMR